MGRILEPEPNSECIVMANALINSAPLVVGIDEPDRRRDLAKYIYRASRALIGRHAADSLEFPRSVSFGVLGFLRLENSYNRMDGRIHPRLVKHNAFTDFTALFRASAFDDAGISYRLPDDVYSERSDEW